jgi:amidase
MPTTWGLSAFAKNVAKTDALAVSRLRAAGAIVFGKTNVPSWLADWQSYNPVYGTTNNPWALNRTPGGSSGGAAAALAAGLTGLELGSDIGASVRNPAHYCGVYGHKPTYGIAAQDGHGLPGMFANSDIAVIGPMARSAEDLDTALGIIAQPDAISAKAMRLVLPVARYKALKDYRVAVLYTHPTAPVDESVQQVLRDLVGRLRGAKVKVDEQAPLPDLEEVHQLYLDLLRSATSGQAPEQRHAELVAMGEALAKGVSLGAHPAYVKQLARAHAMRQREWLAANNRRHELRLQWETFFHHYDILLCPQAATPAFIQNQMGERWERMIPVNGEPQPSTTQLFWAGLAGVFYLPATCAPAGAIVPNDGPAENPTPLPVGVQIIGAQYEDRTTIGFAALMAKEFGHEVLAPPTF